MLESAISRHDPGILQVTAFAGGGEAVSKFISHMTNSLQNASVVPASNSIDVFEIAPLRWWMVSASGQKPVIGPFDARAVTAVDLSSSRVLLRLSHPRWADVVAKGCSIDVTAPPFVSRSYAMTALARFNVLLHAPYATRGCDIYVARSLAGSLTKWLADALLEFQNA